MEDVFLNIDSTLSTYRLTWRDYTESISRNIEEGKAAEILDASLVSKARAAAHKAVRLYIFGTLLPNWLETLEHLPASVASSPLLVLRSTVNSFGTLRITRNYIRIIITLFSKATQTEQNRDIDIWFSQLQPASENLKVTILRNPSRRHFIEVLISAAQTGDPYHMWHYVGASANKDGLLFGDSERLTDKDWSRLRKQLVDLQVLTLHSDAPPEFETSTFVTETPLCIFPSMPISQGLSSAFYKTFYQHAARSLSQALLLARESARRYSAIFDEESGVIRCYQHTTDDSLMAQRTSPTNFATSSITRDSVRDQIFISYSHADTVWCERLMKYLEPLRRSQTIKAWFDQDIAPGSDWDKTIQEALDRTKVAVLLASGDFFRSEFITKHELPYFFEAREQGECTIIWVAVHAYPYELSPLSSIQSVHDPNDPLDRMIARGEQHKAEDVLIQIARLVTMALK